MEKRTFSVNIFPKNKSKKELNRSSNSVLEHTKKGTIKRNESHSPLIFTPSSLKIRRTRQERLKPSISLKGTTKIKRKLFQEEKENSCLTSKEATKQILNTIKSFEQILKLQRIISPLDTVNKLLNAANNELEHNTYAHKTTRSLFSEVGDTCKYPTLVKVTDGIVIRGMIILTLDYIKSINLLKNFVMEDKEIASKVFGSKVNIKGDKLLTFLVKSVRVLLTF